MSIFVVDASVVIKWFVPEIHSDLARRLLAADHRFFAPDLLFAEIANAIWKKVARGELSAGYGQQLVDESAGIAVDSVPTRTLISDAHHLAIATGRTVYDALYVALAIRLNAHLITADERLRNALLAVAPIATYVQLLQAP